jgi:Transposase IS66 family
MTNPPDLSQLSPDDLRALVRDLMSQIAALRDEIARLKNIPPRPRLKPSRMEDGTDGERSPDDKRSSKGQKRPRNGGSKGSLRTADLTIHEEKVLKPAALPEGCRFKGRKRFVVQDLVLEARVTRYHRECYLGPDGKTILAPLPAGVIGHYGPNLIRFVLQQYQECNLTQPKLLAQLHAYGIKISAAELNALLTENKEPFHAEKREILVAGLEVSTAVTTDDTGARHQGKNGHTTHIGNQYFAFFETTESKSRVNFFKMILLGGVFGYRVTPEAIAYWDAHELPIAAIDALAATSPDSFADDADWERHLTTLGISGAQHRQTAAEGALWAAICEQGLLDGIVIVSDGAPQFAIGDHARCWIHAERQVYAIVCATPEQRDLVKRTRARIWKLYRALEAYAKAGNIDPAAARRLRARFDRIFNAGNTGFAALDNVLRNLLAIKDKLLRVLERPDIPLHTNTSEGDIRIRVEKRKISGGTRGDEGRRCCDTFVSIFKTLRKHGISFWDYLGSRLGISDQIVPPIADIIRQAVKPA